MDNQTKPAPSTAREYTVGQWVSSLRAAIPADTEWLMDGFSLELLSPTQASGWYSQILALESGLIMRRTIIMLWSTKESKWVVLKTHSSGPEWPFRE